MLKYFDAKDKYVVDEPSLWTVNGSVDIQYAGGTEHKDGEFTIQVGNIESYNPTEIEQEPLPNPNPTPTEPGESGGGSGGDNEGGNSGGQEGGGDNPDTPINPDPTPSGSEKITFKLINNSGVEARFNGKVTLNVWNDPNYLSTTPEEEWSRNVQVQCTFTGGQKSNNYIVIPVGGTEYFDIPRSSMVYTVHHIGGPEVNDLKDDNLYGNVNYLDGHWYLKSSRNPYNGGASAFIYTQMRYGNINHKDDDTHSSSGMYEVSTATPAKLENGQTYTITINSLTNGAGFTSENNHYVIL